MESLILPFSSRPMHLTRTLVAFAHGFADGLDAAVREFGDVHEAVGQFAGISMFTKAPNSTIFTTVPS